MDSESATPAPHRVLVIQDDPADRLWMATEFESAFEGVRVDWAGTREEVRERLDRAQYDIIFADYQLGGGAASQLTSELRERGLKTPVILVAESAGEHFANVCLQEGVADFVLKRNLYRLPVIVRRALERRGVEEQLAVAVERAHRMSVAVEQGPSAVFMTDAAGRIEYVNRRFTEITGYSADEALGQTPRILKSDKTPPNTYEELWSAITRGQAWRGELLNRRKSGELYWCAASISPVHDAEGAVTDYVAVQEDVSERKWAEEAVREREERLRQITENISEVFFVHAADFSETLYLSPAYELVWGRTVRSAYERPQSFIEAVPAEDRPQILETIASARAGKTAEAVEFRVVHPSGETRWVRARAAPVLNERGEAYRICGVILDITARKATEERLRATEQRLRKLVEASFDVIVQSEGGVIREVSPGFERLLGYPPEDVIGRRIEEFLAEESRELVLDRVRRGIEGVYEFKVVHRNGGTLVVEATGKNNVANGKAERITALRDLTAARELENQLRQAQKLEAVARLAGGVAHDFNNLLTVILTEIELLKLAGPGASPDPREEALGEIEAAARRAAALTRQLLTFSRHDVVNPEVLDPVQLVEGLRKMCGRLIGEDIELELVPGTHGARVNIDGGQLEQVVMNLVINARDAMPEGGRLRIGLDNVELDAAYAEGHPGVSPGPYVRIAVTDTGTGMSKEVLERMFEPFFTTKPAGRGTGLGLATSYGIVRGAGGHISVDSALGLGTTIEVYLPRADLPAQDAVRPRESEVESAKLGATVLVVEDEAAVRRSAVRALEGLGCTVLAAANGREAIDIVRRARSAIDIIFTDLVMPGLAGPEVAAQAKKLVPSVKVVFTTGYTSNGEVRMRALEEGVEILAKPYTPAELSRRIRAALSE